MIDARNFLLEAAQEVLLDTLISIITLAVLIVVIQLVNNPRKQRGVGSCIEDAFCHVMLTWDATLVRTTVPLSVRGLGERSDGNRYRQMDVVQPFGTHSQGATRVVPCTARLAISIHAEHGISVKHENSYRKPSSKAPGGPDGADNGVTSYVQKTKV